MEFFDPLALAVAVIAAALDDGVDYDTDYLDANIWRLLSGGGWMVTFRRTHLLFDHDVKKVAA